LVGRVLEKKGMEDGQKHDGVHGAMKRAQKVVALLEEALELIVDDDPTQPATKYVHAALFETEHRAQILEERYRRTYRQAGRGSEGRVSEEGAEETRDDEYDEGDRAHRRPLRGTRRALR
jgi:hypothetical protein